MINIVGVSRKYNGNTALKSIDLDIVKGEWLGLVGPNGSGKTTMIRIILGLTRPTTGKVYLDGSIPNRERWLAFKARIGFMPERITFYDKLTGEETLDYFASIRRVDRSMGRSLLDEVGLSEAAGRQVGEYSKGMRQRLNLAQALLGDPEVMILDEPTEGLDPHAVRHFFQLLRHFGNHKKTVLLSSHRLGELESQVDRVCILGEGEIKALGTPRELMGALKLKVKIHILLEDEVSKPASSLLNDLGFRAAEEGQKRFTVEIPYSEKTKFLAELHSSDLALDDLWIEEPDLEEVYFEAH